MPEIPVGAEAGLFRRLVRGLFRVPAKTGKDAVARDATDVARHAPGFPAHGPFPRPPNTHADLIDAVRNGWDTHLLTRRALTEAGPEGARALQTLDRYGTKVEYAHGGGSFYDHSANTIHIDLNNGHSAVGLVHESTHVEWNHCGYTANIATMGRDEYVYRTLSEETDATTRELYAHAHLQATQPHLNLPGTALQHQFMAGYHAPAPQAHFSAQAPGTVIASHGGAVAGDAGGRQAVFNEFMSGRVTTSNTGTPYPQYYGDAWDNYQNWMKQSGQVPNTGP